ncbi:MAG: transcriptional regulator [Ilumatobacteraceae bacterium]|nr:transcriptional regulator [Ilumatobacteraceae bacterium]
MSALQPQPRCEHVAVVHRGPDDLARRLAPILHRAAAENAPVLLCLDGQTEACVRSGVGAICESFEFRPADVRSATPGRAMAALHAFMSGAQRSGATAVWSIGAIPLANDGRDHRWVRYEEAVLAMFADQPLRAVCLYDALTTPPAVRDGIDRAHQMLDGEWHDHDQPSEGALADVEIEPLLPAHPPDLALNDFTPRSARRALDAGFAPHLSDASMADLQLICSELATNAVLHGEPPVAMRVWIGPTGCVVQVSDGGSTTIDPYAELRPCAGGAHGGFGLWTVGQIADSVTIVRTEHGNAVTVSLPLR